MFKCSQERPERVIAAVCTQTALFQTTLQFAAVSGGHIPGYDNTKDTPLKAFQNVLINFIVTTALHKLQLVLLS